MRTALRVGSLALFVALFGTLMVQAQNGPGCASDGSGKHSEPAAQAPAPAPAAAPAPAPAPAKNTVHYFPATKAGPVFPVHEPPPAQAQQPAQQQAGK